MPVTTLRPRRLRHSNELAMKNNGAARYPVPQVGFSRFLREAQTRCRIRPARLMQKVLSANRVNIDSLHH